ncbi:MAG TPA: hypothetical protein VHO69_12015 [Phototrophicaceae bacterium]|nr:hypothetical protein [Phototrophicaceae bacterium]
MTFHYWRTLRFGMVLALWVSIPGLVGAQSKSAVVTHPIAGQLVFTSANQLWVADTQTGITYPIISGEDVGYPVWSQDGSKVAYLQGLGVINIFDFNHQPPETRTVVFGDEKLYYPQGWLDEIQVLYQTYWMGLDLKSSHTIDIFDEETGKLTTLVTYQEDALLSEVPLPPGINTFQFKDLRQAVPNPVESEWIAVQMEGIVPGEILVFPEGTMEKIVDINYLWNYQTGQIFSLDQLFSTIRIASSNPIRWSNDGRYLHLLTYDDRNENTNWIVYFDPAVEAATAPKIVDQVEVSDSTIIYDWVGMGDLLLSKSRSDTDFVLYLSPIENGILKSEEFIRLPQTEFAYIRQFDWHITAKSDNK